MEVVWHQILKFLMSFTSVMVSVEGTDTFSYILSKSIAIPARSILWMKPWLFKHSLKLSGLVSFPMNHDRGTLLAFPLAIKSSIAVSTSSALRWARKATLHQGNGISEMHQDRFQPACTSTHGMLWEKGVKAYKLASIACVNDGADKSRKTSRILSNSWFQWQPSIRVLCW